MDADPGTRLEPTGAGGSTGLAALFVRTVVVLGVVASALALWRLKDILAVAFGAIMLAVGFAGLADAISRRTGLPRPWSLALVVVISLGAMGLAIEVFGAMMAAQYDDLSVKLPQSLRKLAAWLEGSPAGRYVLSRSGDVLDSAAAGPAPKLIAGVVGMVGQVASYALVMIASGVFLAIEPRRYRDDFLRLIPRSRRGRALEVLEALADGLRHWLVGRLVVMAAVGVMASLGLWAFGIDAPFALGLTGAVLTFVPYVGAIMAVLPAMLIAFLQEPTKAVQVVLLFWAVHTIEGTFITPYVQDESVDIPPVISIFSTVVFAMLLGAVGVFLAAPITVVLILIVNHLYIEDVLGEAAPVKARPARRLPWRTQRREIRQ